MSAASATAQDPVPFCRHVQYELGLAENGTALSAGQSCTVYKVWGLVLHCTNVILCFSNCVKMHPHRTCFSSSCSSLMSFSQIPQAHTSLKQGLVPSHLAGHVLHLFSYCHAEQAGQGYKGGKHVLWSPEWSVPTSCCSQTGPWASSAVYICLLPESQQSECHSTDSVFSFTAFMELLKPLSKLHSLLTKSVFYFCWLLLPCNVTASSSWVWLGWTGVCCNSFNCDKKHMLNVIFRLVYVKGP